ncbi:MAG: hypothetical protein EOM20_13390 [Spartobacteria bacterium]|nr:hypothetical protein [Spartobacteria bacterium]
MSSVRMILPGALLAAILILPTAAQAAAPLQIEDSAKRIQIRGDAFYVDGVRAFINASFYEYHPAGKLPWQVTPPSHVLRRQIRELKAGGFNAIRWFNTTPRGLQICREENMLIFVQFWIDQEGDFHDETFKADNIRRIRNAVKKFKAYDDVILGYLVMNEPYMHLASCQADVDATLNHLVAVRDAIKEEDPQAYVSFDNWPSLAFLDHSYWDFIAFNVYTWGQVTGTPHGMGYRPFIEWLKKKHAADKPLVIMEYGASVCSSEPAYGGGTEEGQMTNSILMLRDIIAAGAAGACYTHYADQIWKEGEPDVQDDHPEEWFGMRTVDINGSAEMEGRWRPVYFALKNFFRAVLVEPASCATVRGTQRILVSSPHGEDIRYRIDDGPWLLMDKAPGAWWTAMLESTTLQDGLHAIEIQADGPWENKVMLKEYVVVANTAPDPYALQVKVTAKAPFVQEGAHAEATVQVTHMDGRPAAGQPVHWLAYEHSLWETFPQIIQTGDDGTAHLNDQAPHGCGWMTICAGVDVEEGPYKRSFGDMDVVAVGIAP